MYTIITYDIEDDRLRNRVAKILLDAGLHRVQKSVFEGEIRQKDFSKLKAKLKKSIKGHDSIRYYISCEECRQKTVVQGMDLLPEEGGKGVVIR